MASTQTVQDLAARLDRLTYAIHGNEIPKREPQSDKSSTVHTPVAHIRELEHRLRSLAGESDAINDILKLHAKHPSILSESDHSTTLHPSSQAGIVLSHAKLYESLSHQLTALQSSTVPGAAPLAALASLQPRITQAANRQRQQARQFSELRARSAAVVEQWYASGVLGMAEKWAEWEERMRDVELAVRRMEGAMKREKGVV